jgi:hypothetical protein
VFDLTTSLTVVKPDPGRRFQSMMEINEDHSILPVEHGAGTFELTRERIGTRYAMLLFRTFADPNLPADLGAANALLDRIRVEQREVGGFSVPDWDEASLRTIREALDVLAATKSDTAGWRCVVRMYPPRKRIVDGTWTFLDARPAR